MVKNVDFSQLSGILKNKWRIHLETVRLVNDQNDKNIKDKMHDVNAC